MLPTLKMLQLEMFALKTSLEIVPLYMLALQTKALWIFERSNLRLETLALETLEETLEHLDVERSDFMTSDVKT